MPNTKHIESRILDFPLPFKPVIALNDGSKPLMTVRLPYDLKPSIDMLFMYILSNHSKTTTQPAIQIKIQLTVVFFYFYYSLSRVLLRLAGSWPGS